MNDYPRYTANKLAKIQYAIELLHLAQSKAHDDLVEAEQAYEE